MKYFDLASGFVVGLALGVLIGLGSMAARAPQAVAQPLVQVGQHWIVRDVNPFFDEDKIKTNVVLAVRWNYVKYTQLGHTNWSRSCTTNEFLVNSYLEP